MRDRSALPDGLARFGVPRPLAGPVALALPVIEAGVAVLLVLPATGRGAAWASLVLLSLFSVWTALRLFTGDRPPCPCFGAGGGRPISGYTLVRDGVLLALAVIATG